MPLYYNIFLPYSRVINPFYCLSYELNAINKFFRDFRFYWAGYFYFVLGLYYTCSGSSAPFCAICVAKNPSFSNIALTLLNLLNSLEIFLSYIIYPLFFIFFILKSILFLRSDLFGIYNSLFFNNF